MFGVAFLNASFLLSQFIEGRSCADALLGILVHRRLGGRQQYMIKVVILHYLEVTAAKRRMEKIQIGTR
jgi:hypothetical protein